MSTARSSPFARSLRYRGLADLISASPTRYWRSLGWQARPLEAIYPLFFFDALRLKIRDEGLVRNKALHIALGVRADGTRRSWALARAKRGAKFWLRVMNELKNAASETC